MRQSWHPLFTLFSAAKFTVRSGMAWLEAKGYFDGAGLPDGQEVPYRLRQIPMEAVEQVLMDADAAWAMPSDLELREFIYHDEDPYQPWRDSLPEDDPRKDPDTFRHQTNQHHQSYKPDDANQRFTHRRTR